MNYVLVVVLLHGTPFLSVTRHLGKKECEAVQAKIQSLSGRELNAVYSWCVEVPAEDAAQGASATSTER